MASIEIPKITPMPTWDMLLQTVKISEEVGELSKLIGSSTLKAEFPRNKSKIISELFDIIQAAGVALHIMQEIYDGKIWEGYVKHIQKLRDRGYTVSS
jgi:hypothetical protein